MSNSSQKFIARNRAPRVQIEYDVELYGAEKKVNLPFVMGVMADLSGNAGEGKPRVDVREFATVDVDNFDQYLESTQPKVKMRVPNTLTGEGEMDIEVNFSSMDDFSPAAVASKVDSLKRLLDARNELRNLVTFMDGKSGAEELISKCLNDPELLKSLAASAKPSADASETEQTED